VRASILLKLGDKQPIRVSVTSIVAVRILTNLRNITDTNISQHNVVAKILFYR